MGEDGWGHAQHYPSAWASFSCPGSGHPWVYELGWAVFFSGCSCFFVQQMISLLDLLVVAKVLPGF